MHKERMQLPAALGTVLAPILESFPNERILGPFFEAVVPFEFGDRCGHLEPESRMEAIGEGHANKSWWVCCCHPNLVMGLILMMRRVSDLQFNAELSVKYEFTSFCCLAFLDP